MLFEIRTWQFTVYCHDLRSAKYALLRAIQIASQESPSDKWPEILESLTQWNPPGDGEVSWATNGPDKNLYRISSIKGSVNFDG